METQNIKPVTPAILAQAGMTYSISWHFSHLGIVSDSILKAHSPEFMAKQLSREQDDGFGVFAYVKGGRCMGVICFDSGSHAIRHLYVHPDFFGAGVAGALLDFALSRIDLSRGVTLEVMNVNARARHFYEKHGFIYTGRSRELTGWGDVRALTYGLRVPGVAYA